MCAKLSSRHIRQRLLDVQLLRRNGSKSAVILNVGRIITTEVGALDGKHVTIKKTAGSGSVFINYRKFHRVILMGLVDSNYPFLYVDVDAKGYYMTWARCKFHTAIIDECIGFPDSSPLPNDD